MSTTLDAAEFKRLIGLGSFEKIEGCTVSGEVTFRGEEIRSGLRLLHVTFLGPVDFSDAQIMGSLDLTGCWFVRTLRLANAKVLGNLTLDDMIVEATARPHAGFIRGGAYDWEIVAAPLAADSLVVEGALTASFLSVVGHADFSGSRITGDCRLAGFEIRGSLSTAGMHVGGSFVLGADTRGGTITKGHVAGDLNSANIVVGGNVLLSGMLVGGDCNLWSATVEGNLWLSCAVHGDDSEATSTVPTIVRGDVHLGASKVRGHLQIESAQIDGVLKLYSSDVGPVRVSTATGTGDHELRFTGCRIGGLQAQGMRVRGDVTLYCLEVTGLGVGVARSVSFANAHIDSGLYFWSLSQFMVEKQPGADTVHPPEERGCNIVGDIDLSGAVIGAECNFTNLRADGTVLLEDAEIRGDVVFASVVSLLENLSVRFGPVRNRLVARTQEVGGVNHPMASIRRLAMATMTCHNDVDLSGLKLRASASEVDVQSGYGSIEARNIKVTGHLWQYRRVSDEVWSQEDRAGVPPPVADTIVPGSADYSGAKIFHMSLSGATFQTVVSPTDDVVKLVRRRGLLLSGAEISELTIEPLPGDGGDVFPVPISLAGLEVKAWDVKETDANRFVRYRTLLSSDPMFRRSTYLAVERSIRNRGHEEDADRIYREMVRRAHGESRQQFPANHNMTGWRRALAAMPNIVELLVVVPPVLIGAALLQMPLLPTLLVTLVAAVCARPVLAALRWLIWDALLGFGTAPVRIGAVILFFFLFSVVGVYSDPRNMGPTLSAQIAHADATEVPTEWGALDAVSIGLRTHVPLVSWTVRDEWQLADEPGRELYVFRQQLPGRPEDFGLFMMVLNFLAWPPFLAFALRRAFRSAV